MKLSEIKSAPGFEDLLSFRNVEQEDKHNAAMIMFKFLSEIEDVTKNKDISRKKIAELIGTSASYVTQLFRGDKLINLLTLAKLERVLDIEFEISTAKKVGEKKNDVTSETVVYTSSVLTMNLSQHHSTFGEAYSNKFVKVETIPVPDPQQTLQQA